MRYVTIVGILWLLQNLVGQNIIEEAHIGTCGPGERGSRASRLSVLEANRGSGRVRAKGRRGQVRTVPILLWNQAHA